MKKFVKNIILFAILPLFVVVAFDIYLRTNNSLYTEKYDGLLQQKELVEVLILGNSHATYAVDPTQFSDHYAYNLANVSQRIYFDKRLTQKALQEGLPNLNYVLISVDYHSLASSSQGIRNVWSYYANGIKYKEQNYLKETISPLIWGYTPKVAISLLKKDVVRSIKYGKEVVSFDVEHGVNIHDPLTKGYMGLEGQDEVRFTEAEYKSRAAIFLEKDDNKERAEIIADLSEFIEYLIDRDIQPILFSTPTFHEYNNYLNQDQVNRNISDINKLTDFYELSYWRFNEDERFLKDDFYNQDHLNKKGAEKFSKILNEKLNNYSVNNPPKP